MTKLTKKKLVFVSSALVAVLAVIERLTSLGISEQETQSGNRPGIPLSAMLTEKNTISETVDLVDFRVAIPTHLPNSVVFEKGFASNSKDQVTLIYSNPKKSSNIVDRGIEASEGSVIYTVRLQETNPLLYKDIQPNPIKVITKDSNGNVTTKIIPQKLAEYADTMVNDMEAVVETVDAEHGKNLPRLGWWNDGLLYTISADLSNDELVKIAESIQP